MNTYFSSFRIFEQLALALNKTELPRIFSLYWNIFYHSGFLSNYRFLWKPELPWKFSLFLYTFYIPDFWTTCACPEKQKVPWFHCAEYVFFIIQDFWATSACPGNSVCPEIFQSRGAADPRPPASYAYGSGTSARLTLALTRFPDDGRANVCTLVTVQRKTHFTFHRRNGGTGTPHSVAYRIGEGSWWSSSQPTPMITLYAVLRKQ